MTRYEPTVNTRLAGLLQMLMRWSFSGDIQARLKVFEREVLRWEAKAGEKMSANIRMGLVMLNLEEGPLKEHLLMNSSSYTD